MKTKLNLHILLAFAFFFLFGWTSCDLAGDGSGGSTTVTKVEEVTDGNNYFERKITGPPAEMGHWFQVPLAKDKKARMQSVHTVLMPNGKVLMVNGSSNRNTVNPATSNTAGTGVGKDNDIQDGSNLRNYEAINNMCVFDPADNSFTRYDVPPLPNDRELSNDLFCTGHLHMSDGNILFAGGTQRYYPGEKFSGSKSMRYWDWYNSRWVVLDDGADGHWYPSLIEFENGVIMVMSGWNFADLNKTSTIIEFYNPKTGTWQNFDIARIENNPFATRLPGTPAGLDGFQLYPRIYPLPDGRIFITGDGAGWGNNGGGMSKNTYFMDVAFDGDTVTGITFEKGPDRKTYNKIYGSSCVDPSNGNILLFAGQMGPSTQNSNDYGPGPWAEGKGGVSPTADFEVYKIPASRQEAGSWEYYPKYLGVTPEDTRMMHLATILPTRQMVVVNGGNYAYHRPVFYPILFTKNDQAPGGYDRKQMNQALQPRMYHNISLLLPDGRVLTSGGNAARGAFRPHHPYDPALNVYKDADGVYQTFGEGEYGLPAEIWQAEIFSPPYLFIDGPKPLLKPDGHLAKNDRDMSVAHFETDHQITVDSVAADDDGYLIFMKLGSVTHAWDQGQRAVDVTITKRTANEGASTTSCVLDFKTPALSHVNPPGYYMLFYVNEKGEPSVSEMIQMVPKEPTG
ncbi:MAG: galactose oxidase early set domain-containing protein [Bacteroidota bacterium]